MESGTIARINNGYGFITRAGHDKDIFFHADGLVGKSFDDLREGMPIYFEVGQGPKGPSAIFVGLEKHHLVDWVAKEFVNETKISAATTREVIESFETLTPDLVQHLRRENDDLAKVDPLVFEQLVGELMASEGWHNVQWVGKNSDTSADVFAMHYAPKDDGIAIRYFVEAKRRKDRIGVEVFNQVLGVMTSERETHGWHVALIVTLSGVKNMRKFGIDEFRKKGIEVKTKKDLIRWLDGYEPNSNGLWISPDH